MTRPAPSGQAAEVWWFDTREVTLGPADLAVLSADEQGRAAALVFRADRHRYRAAHVLLRRVLAAYTGADPADLRFGREACPRCGGPSGRPVLLPGPGEPAGPVPLRFSLAHAGSAVAIAVADRPVGVDVEQDPVSCVCSLATAMHPADAAAVASLTEPDRHQAVITWWVRAEAVLKCTGAGIAHGLGSFPVLTDTGTGPGPDTGTGPGRDTGGCVTTPLACPGGYQAALALPGPGAVPRVTVVTLPPPAAQAGPGNLST